MITDTRNLHRRSQLPPEIAGLMDDQGLEKVFGQPSAQSTYGQPASLLPSPPTGKPEDLEPAMPEPIADIVAPQGSSNYSNSLQAPAQSGAPKGKLEAITDIISGIGATMAAATGDMQPYQMILDKKERERRDKIYEVEQQREQQRYDVEQQRRNTMDAIQIAKATGAGTDVEFGGRRVRVPSADEQFNRELAQTKKIEAAKLQANIDAIKQKAAAAGLQENTPEYNRFFSQALGVPEMIQIDMGMFDPELKGQKATLTVDKAATLLAQSASKEADRELRRDIADMGNQTRRDIAAMTAANRDGKLSAKAEEARRKVQYALGETKAELSRMAVSANELLRHSGLGAATGADYMRSYIPGTVGADFKAKLEQLKSVVAFSVLQKMREASKTGGALGAVSNFEQLMLQNNIAALEQAQSEPQFRTELKKIVDWSAAAQDRLDVAYQQDSEGFSTGNVNLNDKSTFNPSSKSKKVDFKKAGRR